MRTTCRKATRQTLKSAQETAKRGSARTARMRRSKPLRFKPSSDFYPYVSFLLMVAIR